MVIIESTARVQQSIVPGNEPPPRKLQETPGSPRPRSLYGPIWSHMAPYGLRWAQMVPYMAPDETR